VWNAGGVSVDVKTLSEREREKLTRKLVQVRLDMPHSQRRSRISHEPAYS
jgi:hypothetical protein